MESVVLEILTDQPNIWQRGQVMQMSSFITLVRLHLGDVLEALVVAETTTLNSKYLERDLTKFNHCYDCCGVNYCTNQPNMALTSTSRTCGPRHICL